ncbi:MAG: STAS domain-containing protein [Acidimicrobiales bacterium]|nr:STAS domain-containing protein [Acidimicrobiales bacterium]
MDFRLEVSERDAWSIVAVSGEIDVATSPRFRERLIELISTGNHRIVVDLRWVDFIDSTGLGVLIGALKRLRSHEGELRLVIDDPRVLKIFDITGLDQVFEIDSVLDTAAP